MALREIGATLKLDGEKEFRKGMNDAARGLRVLDSELKASSAAFAGNERSLESLTAKGQLFERKVAQQKKVVEALARAVKESGQMYGEASAKTDGYKIKLNNATAALAKMERELEQNSQAMYELGSDTSRAAKMMDKLERKAKEMNASLRKAGEGLGNVGQKMAMGVTAPVIAGIGLATEGTREFRQDLGKLDAAFKTTGHGVDTGRKLFTDFYGIIGEDDTSIEAVNHLAQMTKNQKELADWTTIATGVYASFGDSLPLEGLTEAANETVKVGKVTGPLADALNWVGINEDEVNAKLETMNSEQKRSAYLTDLLTGKYKKIATEYRNMNGIVIEANESQAALRLEMADLGNKLEPIVTKVVRAVTKLVDAFNNMPEPMQDMIIKFGLIAAAIGPVLIAVGKAMVFFALFGDKMTGIIGIGGKLATFLPRLGALFAGLSGPIGIAIAIVLSLLAVFKRLWDTSPKFRNWVRELGDALENGFKGIINRKIDELNWLIEQINRLPKVNIEPIGKMTKSSGTTGFADFRQLPGNADGTNYWKGGLTWVGERGPELLDIPRGSQIYNNQESRAIANQTLTIGGTVRVEGVSDMGQLVGVTRIIAKEIERGDRRLAGRVRVMPSMA
jgi:phage-related minor tail protein